MFGVPVISNVNADIILSENCGIYIKEPNVTSLYDAFRYMLQNPSIRSRMGSNGLNAVETKYNWDAASRSLKLLYDSFI